jgi:hypothetical protein
MLRDLADGWREYRSRTWMWNLILVWTVHGITPSGPLVPLGAVRSPRARSWARTEACRWPGTVRPTAGLVGAERVLVTSVAVSALRCTALPLAPAVRDLRRVPEPTPATGVGRAVPSASVESG